MNRKASASGTVVDIAIITCLVTGYASLLTAVFAFFGGDWVGAGACLGAAALAFGLVANALLRQ